MTVPSDVPDAPFTYQQIAQLGIPRQRLRELVATGKVRRVLRGVYQRADVPDTTLHRAWAARLVVSPDAVVCDRTAGWLWDVDTFEYHELEVLPPLDTFVLRGAARVSRAGCRGGERDLLPGDIQTLHGLRVTTPLRTALDLGCLLSRRAGLAALDGFMRVHGLTHADLEAELPRYRRRRGVVQLRQIVPLADARAESPGESWTRIAIHDDGLPAPEPQFWVCTPDGQPIFRLDLAYPLHKVAVEYDGRAYHDSLQQRQHDERRRRWLREHGWTVIVVRHDCLKGPALDRWLGELRAALGL
jgi:hypothetical protein